MESVSSNKAKSLQFYGVLAVCSLFLVVGVHSAYAQTDGSADRFYEPEAAAITTFATSVATAAPKIIAAGVLLAVGLVAGKVVGRVVEKTARKILQKANVENIPEVHMVEETVGKFDSVRLIGSTIKWFVYLFFIVAAINALELQQLTSAMTSLWLWVPNLLAFVIIVLIGSIIANYVIKWVNHELMVRHYGGTRYVGVGVKTVVYSIVFAVGLTQIGIGQSVIPTLVSAFSWSIAIAVGAAIAIGLGFTLKDVLPSAIAGASTQRAVFKIGQKIRVGEISGTITAVELLHIIVANEKNESTVIPTKELMNKQVTILPKPNNDVFTV
ncbi:MAG TPA: mechanosensitive ion channel domain-containing protein [Candidatus Nitrosotalea sp.]|nr:mechanosensitive ion channel domain-containing protein [Candidatus Nitrosotalea sp.]